MADFPKGIYFKEPHPNAPDFVKGKVTIKVQDAIAYLQSINDEWLTLDCKISKEGKGYCQVDDWKPNGSAPASGGQTDYAKSGGGQPEDFDSDIPFMRLNGKLY